MNEKHLHILLLTIRGKGNIMRLAKAGLEYVKIADLIIWATKENLIAKENNSIKLTEQGVAKLKDLNLKNKESWIEPEKISRIEKLDIDFIFVPSQTELNFD